MEAQITLFNGGGSSVHAYEDDTIYAMWQDLLQITDSTKRDAQLRKIGNYKFENFEAIPLFDVFIEVVADPNIVADWAFPGWDGGDIGHVWRITAHHDARPGHCFDCERERLLSGELTELRERPRERTARMIAEADRLEANAFRVDLLL